MTPIASTPRRLRPLVFATALLLALPAFAQDAQAPIEEQMTAAQFRAAGLHKLDAGELATLNGWLNRTLYQETTRAVKQAEERVVEERRGFLDAGGEAVSAHIEGTFDGFAKGREYRLDNGQVWRQVDGAGLSGVRMERPEVTISPGIFGVWYLKVDGYNTRTKVERIR